MHQEKKEIKVVTITIDESKFYDEREKSIIFRHRTKFIVFPKKHIHNFEKVITDFPSAIGGKRRGVKAMKFKIPLWLYFQKKDKEEFKKISWTHIIIDNTHKQYI